MSNLEKSPPVKDVTSFEATLDRGPAGNTRRNFLQIIGGAGLASVALMGCDTGEVPEEEDEAVTLDFSNDFGVLNYAYALEQLEAAFYAEASANPYDGISDVESYYLTALAAHEGAHRDFFAEAIPALGGTRIRALEVDFSSIDFSSRTSVLATAQLLEDTGVAAYNGAGRLLESADLLTIAGKIVSVEARHAAAIRSAFQTDATAFADLTEIGMGASAQSGLDAALPPDDVLAAVAGTGLVVTEINTTNL